MHKSNLKKIYFQQKYTFRIVYNKDRYYQTKELFRSYNVLNVYKLNLLNTFIFMRKIKYVTRSAAFHTTFKMSRQLYLTRSLSINYSQPKLSYAKVVSGYLYEVQLYGTTLLLIQRKNLNLDLSLNQK